MCGESYFDLIDRHSIAQAWEEGRSTCYIADRLDVHESTIYHELKRGQRGEEYLDKNYRLAYDPELAAEMRSLKYSTSISRGKDSTASAVSEELNPEGQRRYRAIISAIRHTAQTFEDGARRLQIIRSVYWSAEFGSSALMEMPTLDAQEFRKDFIQVVSQRLLSVAFVFAFELRDFCAL